MNNRNNRQDNDSARNLTVGEAADILGVTVRTLHHWDQVGLASPSDRTWSDYRLYSAADLQRLQRIMVYRELDMPLAEIATLLDDPDADAITALTAQKGRILDKVARLADLERGVDRMIEAHRAGVLLTVEQQREIFGESWDPDWTRQARQRWGHTAQWSEYAERGAKRSPEQWAELQGAMTDLEGRLGAAVRDGVLPGSDAADALVDEHREVFSNFFTLSVSMQVCLGRMYEASAGSSADFAEHYESVAPGLTSWLRQAIDARARALGVDPDTAEWE
ncbi:MerR family transcriptional regulator [Corynebacterium variabile]|uniref:MerR family transcriptional regulator n=1 Tax=Corynebacterium variabile TaxID=1727 RepID=UPI002897F737|nr:MerR family transcriptional regulator [Corynebacterium variabile]